MDAQLQEMLEELIEMINSHDLPEWLLFIEGLENKYIVGGKNAKALEKNIPDVFILNSVYFNILDVNEKALLSIGLSTTFATKFEIDFNPFRELSEEEENTYYYLENLIFRLGILWDLLAQYANELWLLRKEPKRVYYKRFFKEACKKYRTNQVAVDIHRYLSKGETKVVGETFLNNHSYISEFRNRMTHRAAQAVNSVTSQELFVREPTSYILVRACSDYLVLLSFIERLLDETRQCLSEEF